MEKTREKDTRVLRYQNVGYAWQSSIVTNATGYLSGVPHDPAATAGTRTMVWEKRG